jgi:hypothetical protein
MDTHIHSRIQTHTHAYIQPQDCGTICLSAKFSGPQFDQYVHQQMNQQQQRAVVQPPIVEHKQPQQQQPQQQQQNVPVQQQQNVPTQQHAENDEAKPGVYVCMHECLCVCVLFVRVYCHLRQLTTAYEPAEAKSNIVTTAKKIGGFASTMFKSGISKLNNAVNGPEDN